MWFEGKWLQNRLRVDKNELNSLLAVDIQGHQRGGFCIVPFISLKSNVKVEIKNQVMSRDATKKLMRVACERSCWLVCLLAPNFEYNSCAFSSPCYKLLPDKTHCEKLMN